MTTTAAPLVVADDITTCDSRYEHEIRILTDGQTGYAYPLATGDRLATCGNGSRVGTEIRFACNQPVHGQPCPGEATVDLTTEGVWTGNTVSIHLLTVHGQKVDQ